MSELIFFVLGVVLGGLMSWGITHRYYLKAGADQRSENNRLKAELRPRTTLLDFERYLASGLWTEERIDHTEMWTCNSDNTFQIRVGERDREFSEPWTAVYPDSSGSSTYPVYLY